MSTYMGEHTAMCTTRRRVGCPKARWVPLGETPRKLVYVRLLESNFWSWTCFVVFRGEVDAQSSTCDDYGTRELRSLTL